MGDDVVGAPVFTLPDDDKEISMAEMMRAMIALAPLFHFAGALDRGLRIPCSQTEHPPLGGRMCSLLRRIGKLTTQLNEIAEEVRTLAKEVMAQEPDAETPPS